MLTDAFSPRAVDSKVARGLIKAGYGVFKTHAGGGAGTSMLDPGEVYQIPNPGADADVDAIVTAYTSSTGIQTFSGTALNGVVGATEMQPPRLLTFVFSNHADFDATNITLTGISPLGVTQTENIAIPNGGNATVNSTLYYASVTSIVVPAQSGTGGTATFGIAALTTLVIADFRGVAVRQPCKTTIATAGIYGYPGIASVAVTADYVDAEPVPVLTEGGIWVYSEEAVSDGDPVYVRIATGAGGSSLGAFRNDADSGSCVLVVGAKFKRDSTTAGPAWAKFAY
jgi:hypothetical protein